MLRQNRAISLQQAAQESPLLGSLMQRLRASQACKACIQPLIPPLLRPRIQCGSLQDGVWCVVVSGSAVAAKVRHLVPLWQKHLQQQGHPVEQIRIHIAGSQR